MAFGFIQLVGCPRAYCTGVVNKTWTFSFDDSIRTRAPCPWKWYEICLGYCQTFTSLLTESSTEVKIRICTLRTIRIIFSQKQLVWTTFWSWHFVEVILWVSLTFTVCPPTIVSIFARKVKFFKCVACGKFFFSALVFFTFLFHVSYKFRKEVLIKNCNCKLHIFFVWNDCFTAWILLLLTYLHELNLNKFIES